MGKVEMRLSMADLKGERSGSKRKKASTPFHDEALHLSTMLPT